MAKPKKPDTPAGELEGGFVQVREAKAWRGTVRRRDDKSILWICNHIHSRPEYNARWTEDPDQAWEVSALNCGRLSHSEWPKPKGTIGLLGRRDIPFEQRDDSRRAMVDGTEYIGTVMLTNAGRRILKVTAPAAGYGVVHLDATPPRGVTRPALTSDALEEWATAAWLLRGGVWGVTFQDSRLDMTMDRIYPRAVTEILGKDYEEHKPKGTKIPAPKITAEEVAEEYEKEPEPKEDVTPHIQIGRKRGRRTFQVIGRDGSIVEEFFHRGRAAQALEEVARR